MCADPLSTYPSYKELSQLKVDPWVRLAVHTKLSKDKIETIRRSGNPTAKIFIAAKKENLDFKWKDVLEGLLAIGEYELAERVCTEQGWLSNSKCLGTLPLIYLESPNSVTTPLNTINLRVCMYDH